MKQAPNLPISSRRGLRVPHRRTTIIDERRRATSYAYDRLVLANHSYPDGKRSAGPSSTRRSAGFNALSRCFGGDDPHACLVVTFSWVLMGLHLTRPAPENTDIFTISRARSYATSTMSSLCRALALALRGSDVVYISWYVSRLSSRSICTSNPPLLSPYCTHFFTADVFVKYSACLVRSVHSTFYALASDLRC